MKVRTQLTTAFLALAILPLSAIVLYSYAMSKRAFQAALEAEARSLVDEIREGGAELRDDLSGRLSGLAQLPVQLLADSDSASSAKAARTYGAIMDVLGETAPLVEFLVLSVPDEATSDERLFFIYPSQTLADALDRLIRIEADELEGSGISTTYLAALVGEVVREASTLPEHELQALLAQREQSRQLLGRELTVPLIEGDETVAELSLQIASGEALRETLSSTHGREDEIAYARDAQGSLLVDDPQERRALENLQMPPLPAQALEPQAHVVSDFLIVEARDPSSRLVYGIARPLATPIQEIRQTAVRNFSLGLLAVLSAALGVAILSGRMTRNLHALMRGAERLARGELDTTINVRSKDEFAQLAETMSRMARDLDDNQQRLLDEERRRKEQEIEQRLLEAENERKSRELEEARLFQLSLLPEAVPEHPEVEVAVFMRTATEVGGDYYDFLPTSDGALKLAIGDAVGHGAKAGTMVTVVKGILTADSGRALPEILASATAAIKRMKLQRMNMAVALAHILDGRIAISSAGMPPALVYRHAEGSVEEVSLAGTPLGTMERTTYSLWESELAPDDTVLMMSDGFPELLDQQDRPLGYSRTRSLFSDSAHKTPEEIIHDLTRAVEEWTDGRPLADDITFLVLKKRRAPESQSV